MSYTYYGNGNIDSITDSRTSSAPNLTSDQFTIDTKFAHRILSTESGKNIAYDPNGNMTSDGINAITYDINNMPVTVGSTLFTYDGNGTRV